MKRNTPGSDIHTLDIEFGRVFLANGHGEKFAKRFSARDDSLEHSLITLAERFARRPVRLRELEVQPVGGLSRPSKDGIAAPPKVTFRVRTKARC